MGILRSCPDHSRVTYFDHSELQVQNKPCLSNFSWEESEALDDVVSPRVHGYMQGIDEFAAGAVALSIETGLEITNQERGNEHERMKMQMREMSKNLIRKAIRFPNGIAGDNQVFGIWEFTPIT
ncbi:hypothetical protein ACMFMF_007619 [Clarireedia jacksonii]